DINLTPRLAVEAHVGLLPQHVPSQFRLPGGRTFQALAGIRAKVVNTRRFALFGLIRPGLTRFSDVIIDPTAVPVRTGPANYFTLSLGGGMEYYPTPRLITRFEVTNYLIRVPNFTVSNGLTTLSGPGGIDDRLRISAGIGYRLGTLRETGAEKSVSGKLEFGPEFASFTSRREGALDGVRTDAGAGGFFSYKILPFFYADSSLIFFPRNTASAGVHDGGRILQGLFGIKAGIRRNRIGLFGKVRPGFHSYSAALSTNLTVPGPLPRERVTNFVEDLGGVVEFYASPRTVLRFDASDLHIYYSTRKGILFNGTPFAVAGGPRLHSIRLSSGIGFRF
ncbi:MAG TPA: hypothetical protein VEU31_04715, partial [Candidatus Acidoferrales bacterium]|nr:hypothetical protein [Candidatus Acidoferrales bacterium]